MAGVREVYRKLEALKNNLRLIAEQSVSEVQEDYVESQKHQLEQGVSSDGSRLQNQRGSQYPYTRQYAKYKAGKGLQTEVVDLKLTNKFYKGIIATVESGVLRIESTDEKADYLNDNYNGVFGLSKQEMHDFLYDYLRPVYRKNILEFIKQ